MRDVDFTTAFVAVFLTLLALAPVGYMAYRSMPPRVATVDLQRLVDDEQKSTMEVISSKSGDVSADQRAAIERLTVDFAKKLSDTVDAIGVECKCVIVNKAALLGGVTMDYTDAVRDRMKR